MRPARQKPALTRRFASLQEVALARRRVGAHHLALLPVKAVPGGEVRFGLAAHLVQHVIVFALRDLVGQRNKMLIGFASRKTPGTMAVTTVL